MADQSTTSPPGLRLRPFPAMRFDPATVGDVGEVTSPPYDVLDRAMIEDLLSAHPRNIVRLILPRLVNEPLSADDPYISAAKRLARWRRKGTLRTDPTPALYVYEYGTSQHSVCGLVGALQLPKPGSATVLPHEHVIHAIVADRLAGIVATKANLEPILLVYDGAGSTAEEIDDARQSAPLTDVVAADGTFHRVWAITDSETQRRVRRKLSEHQALIADGHHRFAAYQQLRRRHREIGDGPGPWDRGLALLIDQSAFPLRLGAIHRSLAETALESLEAPPGCRLGPPYPTAGPPEPPPKPGQMVITDGSSTRILEVDRGSERAVVPDVEVLHGTLLPSWSIPDDRVGYHHTVAQTLHSARQDAGVAVLLHPASTEEVMAVARSGRALPRKATSFGPKPRMGVLMRAFDDEA